MAAFKINLFSGLRPRLPESLLPEGSATIAQNCDFAYGELRNTKGGFSFGNLANNAQSIYTDDGLTFYSWERDVNAVRSPLASDLYNRLYYTGDSGFKVANRLSTRTTGGVPSSAYLAGVPRPSIKPLLTVSQPKQVTTNTAAITFQFHWEYGGVKHQEQTVSPTAINNTQYQFTPPAKDTATPENAFPVLRMTATWLADNSQVFDLYTDNSSLSGAGSLYSLALTKDVSGSTYTVTFTTNIKEEDKETRAYVYVYRNIYDEQGPPSEAATVTTSAVLDVSVVVTNDNAGSYAPIKQVDIYRTPTGSTIAEYFYVGSVNVLSGYGTYQFADTIKAELLNEVLESTDWYPPDQALTGLMSLPNGILCAWKGNELHFSEAYKPWAWPPKYIKPLASAIVGGIVYGSGAVVTTTSIPYMVSGVSPDSMTASKINVNQAGVSKWSIAVVDGAVMYASNDGLVTLAGATASLAQSQKFFTREVWRQAYSAGLSAMRFAVWDGRLVVFSASGAFTPFMIRFDEADGTMTDLPSFYANCAFISQLSDQFYYVFNSALYQFNGGSSLSAAWQSREFVMPRPVNFGICQALVEGTWAMEFWAYHQPTNTYQKKHTQALTSGLVNFRLPSGYESDRYRVKISGTGRFRELRVAQTTRELANL